MHGFVFVVANVSSVPRYSHAAPWRM